MIRPPEFFDVGPLHLRTYALCILAGTAVAYYLAKPATRRLKLSAESLQLSIFYGLIPGIIGARLYHVIDKWAYYSDAPGQLFAVWNGGLGIFGGLAGGILGLWLFARRMRLPLISILDIWAPGVLFGQAIGRIGNWANQEAFGPPTNLPWKVFIDPEHRPGGYAGSSYFHPTFLYELLWDLVGLAVILFFRKKLSQKPGATLGAYLVVFGTGRFVVEFFRFDTAHLAGVDVAQTLSVILVGAGVYLLSRAGAGPAARSKRARSRTA